MLKRFLNRNLFVSLSKIGILSMCSTLASLNAQAIYNGIRAGYGEANLSATERLFLPATVFVGYTNINGGAIGTPVGGNCSGTLIKDPESANPRLSSFVMTASHCLEPGHLVRLRVSSSRVYGDPGSTSHPRGMNSESFFVSALEHQANWPAYSEAAEIWANRYIVDTPEARRNNSSPATSAMDMALIRLKNPIYGTPIELKHLGPSELRNNRRRIFAAGNGDIGLEEAAPPAHPFTHDLYYYEVSRSHTIARSWWLLGNRESQLIEITNRNNPDLISILAVTPQGTFLPNGCKGDSGGPLIIIEEGKAFLTGVFVTGISRAFQNETHPCDPISNYAPVPQSLDAFKRTQTFHWVAPN